MVVGVTGFQLIKETYKSFWTGECLRCDGTGRLSCTKCKGFGYLRKSRRSPSDDDVSNIYLCPFCGSQARNQSRKEWRSAAIDRACYVKGILRSLCRVLAPATSVRAKEASGLTCPTSSGCAGYLVSLAWKGTLAPMKHILFFGVAIKLFAVLPVGATRYKSARTKVAPCGREASEDRDREEEEEQQFTVTAGAEWLQRVGICRMTGCTCFESNKRPGRKRAG